MRRVILAGLALAAVLASASAHDPSEPFADWFMSLHQPDNPVASCCGPSDQFYATEYHEDSDVPGGFLVTVDGLVEPVHVPPEKVNWDDVHTNYTGRGVLFMSSGHDVTGGSLPGYVYCFVPGIGT